MRLIWHIVIDNMNTVDENTFGKKVGRAINAEMYAWDWQDDFSRSRHLLQSALLDDVYEVHSSGFYKTKTRSEDYVESGAHNDFIIEFFF